MILDPANKKYMCPSFGQFAPKSKELVLKRVPLPREPTKCIEKPGGRFTFPSETWIVSEELPHASEACLTGSWVSGLGNRIQVKISGPHKWPCWKVTPSLPPSFTHLWREFKTFPEFKIRSSTRLQASRGHAPGLHFLW